MNNEKSKKYGLNNLRVKVYTPEKVNGTIKQIKINILYDILKGK